MPRTLSVSAERLGRRALFALALCRSALSSTASRYDVAPRAPNVSLSVAVIRRRVKQNKCSTYSSVPVLWRSDSSPLRNSQMPPNRNGSFPARHRSSTVIYSCGAAVSTTINQGTVESLLSLGKLTLHSLQGAYFFSDQWCWLLFALVNLFSCRRLYYINARKQQQQINSGDKKKVYRISKQWIKTKIQNTQSHNK